MAALDATSLELARSFTQDDIPIKLRCATCNRFAVDSVKLPCCDQSICGDCATGLPEQCPICDHSPLAAEECRPNKSLRMTIKAYLKNEEKKRSKSNTATPVQPSIETAPPETPAQVAATDDESVERPVQSSEQHTVEASASVQEVAEKLEAEPNKDERTPTANGTELKEPTQPEAEHNEDEDEDEDDEDDDVVITTERPPNDNQQETDAMEGAVHDVNHHSDQEQAEVQSQHQDFNFDQNQQGFNSMNFGGMNGFNPMMAMGMPNFMGMPNMMGMPGMNMDPSMMFNGGFGGMDMSMMGMGMGMNGFGGMPGMNMNGPGFFPGQGGYNNNSNFGNHMHQNFRNDRGFGGRPYGRGGYGRGRGYNNAYRGRGGFGYHNQNYGHSQGFMNQRANYDQSEGNPVDDQQPGRRGSPDYGPANPEVGPANETGDAQKQLEGKEVANGAHASKSGEGLNANGNGDDASGGAHVVEEQTSGGAEDHDHSVNQERHSGNDQALSNNPDFQSEQNDASAETGVRGRGGFRGGRGGRDVHASWGMASEATELTPVQAPPINAPTGPKAMREGKPNSGWFSRTQPSQVPTGPAHNPDEEKSRYEDRHDRGRSKPRSRSRSRSRSRHGSHRHKHRSYDEDDYESEETYQRRKERERRKRKDRERERDEDELSSRKDRSREESREDDSSRRRHRDKYDDYKSSRSRRERSRDRRKHRHRSRSPDRDADVNGEDDDKYRKSRSDRKHDDDHDSGRKERSSRKHSRKDEDVYDDKDRSSRHSRSSRKHEDLPSVVEPQLPDDFKIKGSKSNSINPAGMPPPTSRRRSERRPSFPSAPSTPLTPTGPSDPYAEERERRHAERVLKEEQRRQSSSSLGKRATRDDENTPDGLESAPKGPRLDSSKYRHGRKDRRTMQVSASLGGMLQLPVRNTHTPDTGFDSKNNVPEEKATED